MWDRRGRNGDALLREQHGPGVGDSGHSSSWISEGDDEGEVGNEMGEAGRGGWRSVQGAGLCGGGRPWEGLGLKGGGFWTRAEGLASSHSQGFPQVDS